MKTLESLSVNDLLRQNGFSEESISSIEKCTESSVSKYLYIILMESGLVKIGVSSNPESRFKKIEKSSGFKISKIKIFNVKRAFKIESELHKYFSVCKTQGEFFKIDFDIGVSTARNFIERERQAV